VSEEGGPRIFLCYRRDDTPGYAGWLWESLTEQFGPRKVFRDIDEIEPGMNFVEAINSAMAACLACLVLIGPRWLAIADQSGRARIDLDDDYVRLEVEAALSSNIRVIPVLVQGAEMPVTADLPTSLKPLALRNAFDLSDARWRHDVNRLTEVLASVLESSNILDSTQEIPSPRSLPPSSLGTGHVDDRARGMAARVRTLVNRWNRIDAYWLAFGVFSTGVVFWLLLGFLGWRYPSLVGGETMTGMVSSPHAQGVEDFLLSSINLGFGLLILWLVPNDRTARWLAFGIVGTAVAFNLSAHHLLERFVVPAGIDTTQVRIGHVAFHLVVASSYAYALMLFPDGRFPRFPPLLKGVLPLLALLVLAYSLILYKESEGYFILYFGAVVVACGLLGLAMKARYSDDPNERRHAGSFLRAYLIGVSIASLFVIANGLIQVLRNDGLDLSSAEGKADLVVLSMAPILTAIPIVLFLGLIRDRLWGLDDPGNKPLLYGLLVAAVVGAFTLLDFLIYIEAQHRFGGGLVAPFVAIILAGALLLRTRERLVDTCRKLVYGIDSDSNSAFVRLSQTLGDALSSADVLPALSETIRLAVGGRAGELTVILEGGERRTLRWPAGSRQQLSAAIPLMVGGESVGDIAVGKAAGYRLSKRDREIVSRLGTEAALTLRTWLQQEGQSGSEPPGTLRDPPPTQPERAE
jgi:hypothetical protein